MSVLSDKSFNNIANFITSEIVRETLTSEDLYNEFIQFSFGKSKDEMMALVGATMVARTTDSIDNSIDGDKEFLVKKMVDFIDSKSLDENKKLDFKILLDEESKTISKIMRNHNIGFARASKIHKLKKTLI